MKFDFSSFLTLYKGIYYTSSEPIFYFKTQEYII